MIDFEELRSLFGDMIDRDSKKVDEKKVFYQKQVAERKARKERAKAIREKMRGDLVDVTEVEQLLAVQFRNNIGKAKATFKVLDLNGGVTARNRALTCELQNGRAAMLGTFGAMCHSCVDSCDHHFFYPITHN